MECPSTLLCCHAAVKPTSFDTFLNHENPGTDTLLPIQFDDSREDSLELPPHLALLFAVHSWLSCLWPTDVSFSSVMTPVHETGEDLPHSLFCPGPCSLSPSLWLLWFVCKQNLSSTSIELCNTSWLLPHISVIHRATPAELHDKLFDCFYVLSTFSCWFLSPCSVVSAVDSSSATPTSHPWAFLSLHSSANFPIAHGYRCSVD